MPHILDSWVRQALRRVVKGEDPRHHQRVPMGNTGSAKYCIRCGQGLAVRAICAEERLACTSCEWVYYEDPKVATGCVIFDDEKRVLLVKRSIDPVGKWTFPGGYMDRFEDPIPAAKREVLEETGTQIRVDRLLDIYRGPESPVLVLVYLAELDEHSPSPQALHECQDIGFFTQNEVPWGELAFGTTQRALGDAFALKSR